MNPTSQCDQWPLQLQELCSGSSRQPWRQHQNNTFFSLTADNSESFICESLFWGRFEAFLTKTHFLGGTMLQCTGWRRLWGNPVQPQLLRVFTSAQHLPPENNPTCCSSLEMCRGARGLGEGTSGGPSHWGHSLPSVALTGAPRALDAPS